MIHKKHKMYFDNVKRLNVSVLFRQLVKYGSLVSGPKLQIMMFFSPGFTRERLCQIGNNKYAMSS